MEENKYLTCNRTKIIKYRWQLEKRDAKIFNYLVHKIRRSGLYSSQPPPSLSYTN